MMTYVVQQLSVSLTVTANHVYRATTIMSIDRYACTYSFPEFT